MFHEISFSAKWLNSLFNFFTSFLFLNLYKKIFKTMTTVLNGHEVEYRFNNSDPEFMYNTFFSKAKLKKVLRSKTRAEKKQLDSMVLEVIEKGDILEVHEVFYYLLANGYSLPVMNEQNQTALHLVFYKNDDDICRLVLKYLELYEEGSADCNGLNYFHIACFYLDKETVKQFLMHGADVNSRLHEYPNARYRGFTPLHFAVLNHWAEVEELVEMLLTEGANIDAVDEQGRTPFHILCCAYEEECYHNGECQSVQMMRFLLKKNVDVNAKDKNGNTPLLNIFPDVYEEFERLLAWSTQETPIFETQQKLDFLLSHGADVTAVNNNGDNILHRTVRMAKFSRHDKNFSFDDKFVVKFLRQILESNSALDIDAMNNGGESLLTLAMLCLSPDIIEFLIDKGADLNGVILKPDAEFYCYPNVVPNLETVQTIFKLIDLFLEKGLTFKLGDHLAILRFLIHNKTDCQCGSMESYDTEFFLTSQVVCFGSETHIKYVFENYPTKYRMNIAHILTDFTTYFHCMNVAGLYLDSQVKSSIEQFLTNFTFKPFSSDVIKEIVVECNKLKTIKLNDNVSLYDLLLKHHSENIKYFRDNVSNVELFENLNHYKDIVKGHITKALIRDFVLKTSRLYLESLLVIVPNLCCDLILHYLSNEDILNMCSASIME